MPHPNFETLRPRGQAEPLGGLGRRLVRDMNVAEICPKNLATQALVVCNSSIRFGDPSYEMDLRSILRVYERSFKEG